MAWIRFGKGRAGTILTVGSAGLALAVAVFLIIAGVASDSRGRPPG